MKKVNQDQESVKSRSHAPNVPKFRKEDKAASHGAVYQGRFRVYGQGHKRGMVHFQT